MIRCQKENFTPYCRKISYKKKNIDKTWTSCIHTFFTSLWAISSINFRFSANLAGTAKPLIVRSPASCNKGARSQFWLHIYSNTAVGGPKFCRSTFFCKNLNLLSKYNLISCIVIGTFGTPSLFKLELVLVHWVGSKNCLSLLPLSTKPFQVCW